MLHKTEVTPTQEKNLEMQKEQSEQHLQNQQQERLLKLVLDLM
jgi:hypothetical protein